MHLLICPQLDILVLHFEKEPLCVAASIGVILQPQVVLGVVNLGSFSQIAALKTGIKHEYTFEVWHKLLGFELVVLFLLLEARHVPVDHFVVITCELAVICWL